MKHPLKEAWNKMMEQGVMTQLANALKPQDQQNNTQQQTIDPNKQKQMDNIQQQIRDIDTKIAPLLDKKRKLENDLAKLKKQ